MAWLLLVIITSEGRLFSFGIKHQSLILAVEETLLETLLLRIKKKNLNSDSSTD